MIAVDFASGAVLAEKNADTPLPPASMSKIMTIYMAFEALEQGRLQLDEMLPVSRAAAAYRGSTMFLRAGERVSVEDLIRGVVVLSGNDASAVLAEALSPDGTEAGFARLMTERGQELGLKSSNFTNSNGWPDPEHLMSARDLALIATHIIRTYPEYYKYFAEKEFRHDDRAIENRYNRNPLLKFDFGGDGLKTGYTRDAGYGIVGSVRRGNRRVVFVLAGLETRGIREIESERIANWFFRQFEEKTIFKAGQTVVEVPVWMGDAPTVSARVVNDATILLPAASAAEITATAVIDMPVLAPIEEGQSLGQLEVTIPELSIQAAYPLIAANSLERGGLLVRVMTAIRDLVDKSGITTHSLFDP